MVYQRQPAADTLLNFLLVLYVGKRYLYGPVMKMIQDRQKEIDDMYAKADEAKSDAAKLRDTYQQQLSQAQSESDRIVREATLRAQNREEEILRKASAEADAIRVKASVFVNGFVTILLGFGIMVLASPPTTSMVPMFTKGRWSLVGSMARTPTRIRTPTSSRS